MNEFLLQLQMFEPGISQILCANLGLGQESAKKILNTNMPGKKNVPPKWDSQE